jgi:hypothetical protein
VEIARGVAKAGPRAIVLRIIAPGDALGDTLPG